MRESQRTALDLEGCGGVHLIVKGTAHAHTGT